MAAKIKRHRYRTKLRHCHLMYLYVMISTAPRSTYWKTTWCRKATTSLSATKESAFGFLSTAGRYRTARSIRPGFRLTNSIASWSTPLGNTRANKSTLRQLSTEKRKPGLFCGLISSPATNGNWPVPVQFSLSLYTLHSLAWNCQARIHRCKNNVEEKH